MFKTKQMIALTSTARIKKTTQTKIKRAMLRDKIEIFEVALNVYVIEGIKAYREKNKVD